MFSLQAKRCFGFLLVALLYQSPTTAEAKTYVVKPGRRAWTAIGKSLHYRARRPKRRLKLVRLQPGPGFVIDNPKRAYGTRLAVYRINMVMAAFQRRYPSDAPVRVHDLSKRGGGPLPNHMTHMRGLDVDLPLIVNRRLDGRPRLERGRTWFLLRSFVESCDVDYVFLDRAVQKALYEHAVRRGYPLADLASIFQYPRSARSRSGIVRHWPNHHDHLHIRFRRENAPMLPIARGYCSSR